MRVRSYRQEQNRKVRRRKIAFWTSMVVIIGSIAFGATHFFIQHLEAAKVTVDTNTSEVYPGLNLKTTTKEAKYYTESISLALVEEKEINQTIGDWTHAEETNFISKVDDQKEELAAIEDKHLLPHLNIQTDTKKLADRIYSLELISEQVFNQEDQSKQYLPILMDLNTNERLDAGDFFELKEDPDNLHEIQEIIVEHILSEEGIANLVDESKAKGAVSNPEGWNLHTDLETVYFYFAEDELLANALGPIKIAVPMDELVYYLNPIFAEKLGIEIPEKVVQLDSDGKYVAITFDDGPHATVTPRVLDTLKEHNALATFYMLGSQIDYYPEMAKRVADEGHELADHTMSHKFLPKLSYAEIEAEIQQSNDNMEAATGLLPKSLRPPYGAFNDNVKAIAAEKDLPIIMWSVDSLDWKYRNVDSIHSRVMSAVHPGAIILLHDIHATTADALPGLLTALENEGYEMVTVSQLLDLAELEDIGPHHGIDY